MIQEKVCEVTSAGLAVDERLRIKKHVIEPENKTGNEKRVCIVTGTHGDELEGQYVCYEVNRIIKESPERLHGIVEVFPALNPLGVDSIERGIPMFDLDMNRIFPGDKNGYAIEQIASGIVDDIAGADLCIDIHASNIYLMEIPQARVNINTAKELVPIAGRLNLDFIWVHESSTVLESTLAYSLNSIGVPTIVVEMGVGMRITEEYTRQLTDGIFCVLKEMGVWSGNVKEPRDPIVSTDGEVGYVNANAPGIFVPCVDHLAKVKEGQIIGRILNPLLGSVEEELAAPVSGMVFTIREYPVVSAGSLIARVLGGDYRRFSEGKISQRGMGA